MHYRSMRRVGGNLHGVREVHRHDIGALANLQRTNLLVHANKARRIDGGHAKHIVRRQESLVT